MVLPLNLFSERGKRPLLSACRYFATERWEFYGVCTTFQSKKSEFDILVALHGEGRIEWNNGSIHFQSGECWLVPTLLRPFWSKTTRHAALLRAYLPDVALLRAELRGNGHSKAAVAGRGFVYPQKKPIKKKKTNHALDPPAGAGAPRVAPDPRPPAPQPTR